MNILQLLKYYFPFSGGIETVTKDLCEGLVEAKLSVQALCSSLSRSRQGSSVNGVEITRLTRHLNLFSQAINFNIVNEIRSRLDEVNIVHIHGPNPLWELSLLMCAKDNTRIVYTHHSDIVNQKSLKYLYRPFQQQFFNRCDRIIVPTLNHIRYSEVLKPYAEKCHIINFGLKLEKFFSFQEEPRQSQKIKETHQKYAIFIGRLVPYKGLDMLIKAFKNIEGLNLLIIGDGPLKPELKSLVQEFKLNSTVKVLGKVLDDYEFLHLIHNSEFLILPSINQSENFGLVQLEAMAMKKPVICSNLKSGASTVVKNNETGLLFQPASIEDLTDKIRMMLENDSKVKEMGDKAFTRLREEYSYKTMIESHIKLYEDLL